MSGSGSGCIILLLTFRFNKAMCGDRLEEATRTFTTFTTALREIEKSEDLVIYAPSLDHEKEENK